MPDAPVPLADIRLEWDERPVPLTVADPADGLPDGYRTYAEAMAALAPPKVFEDRPSYRLLDARLPVLRFGPARYFDGVNVGESVAHELAAGADGLATRTHEAAARASEFASGVGGLAVRERVGDPCDLGRRAALCAVTTVTVTTSGAMCCTGATRPGSRMPVGFIR